MEPSAADSPSQAPRPVEIFLERLEQCGCQPRRCGNGYQAHCPAHSDRNPSLSVTSGSGSTIRVHCFAGCTREEVIQALGLTPSDLRGGSVTANTPKSQKADLPPEEELRLAAARLQSDPHTRQALREERALSAQTIRSAGLGLAEDGRILVPMRDPAGRLLTVERYRLPSERRAGEPGMVAAAGHERPLYVPNADLGGAERVFVCESAMDALAATSAGVPAVAAPSAAGFRGSWADLLTRLGVGRAIVVGDCDEAGRAFAHEAAMARPGFPAGY